MRAAADLATVEATLAAVVARLEITDLLASYCRGVDRRDAESIAAAYHPDGVDRRPYGPDGIVESDRRTLANRAVRSFDGTSSFSQHHLTTQSIKVNVAAGVAVVESYVIALHPMLGPDGVEQLRAVGGRYLDRLEHRGGRWAIAVREMVVDWSREDVPGSTFLTSLAAPLRAGAGNADPSASLLSTL